MATVEQMQIEIAKLPPEDFQKLARWIDEVRAEAWDRQIEMDSNSGALDFLSKELDEDIAQRRTRPTDELCDATR